MNDIYQDRGVTAVLLREILQDSPRELARRVTNGERKMNDKVSEG